MGKIVIRVDSSLSIGSGHVIRCLTLAKVLKNRGFDLVFLCKEKVGDHISLVSKDFQVISLKETAASSDFDDIKLLVGLGFSVDLMIVDHYELGADWERAAAKMLGCKLFVIDDLVRCHDANLILDQTFGREAFEYSNSAVKILNGCKYALLKPDFQKKREMLFKNDSPNEKLNVLIFFGGGDVGLITYKILPFFINSSEIEKITVLINEQSACMSAITSIVNKSSNITIKNHVDNMALEIGCHDLVVGASGASTWERACLGIPGIYYKIAENQTEIFNSINNLNIGIAASNGIGSLQEYLKILKGDYQSYRDANFKLCDGLGVYRVATEVENLLEYDCSRVDLRTAIESDIDTVFNWQKIPETRRYALDSNTPSYENHVQWMRKKLENYKDYFYIIMSKDSNEDLGVVRLDYQAPQKYLVSIFLDSKFYGKGYGKEALLVLHKLHPQGQKVAVVLKNNTASHKLFQSAGYTKINEEKYIK